MPWHPVPRRAACTYLQYRLLMTCSRRIGAVTCSWLIKLRLFIKLRLAYILCYFIRNRRCSLIFLSGFTSREYLIASVDFIVALRRTKGRGRRTLRSPPSPSSGLHLIHPGRSASAGHICCRGLIPIQVAVFRCCRYSPVSNIVQLSVFGLGSLAFQSGCWAWSVRFSLLGGGAVRACGYGWFCNGLS